MSEILILKDLFTVDRSKLAEDYEAMQRSANLHSVGWRLREGSVNLPTVEVPAHNGIVSFYTVFDSSSTSAEANRWTAKLKSGKFAQTMAVKTMGLGYHELRSAVDQLASALGVAQDKIHVKFIETNARLLLHSDAYYDRLDQEANLPGYELINEGSLIPTCVNWTLRGHEAPLHVKGRGRFITNESANLSPLTFNTTELHGTRFDTDRLTLTLRLIGLTYEEGRALLMRRGLVKEVRS